MDTIDAAPEKADEVKDDWDKRSIGLELKAQLKGLRPIPDRYAEFEKKFGERGLP